ncbi:hypothetical protein WJU16_00860 [Chitinophaga pollutisoli]|uniref:Uncharacterized protein n=1 Tax=Chitinophaga pollutisoli TaxID=3133966 RepID=A0ABZ2YQI3_9BACT
MLNDVVQLVRPFDGSVFEATWRVVSLDIISDNILMITKEKILVYKKYHGDLDDWSRWGSRRERRKIAVEEWRVLESYCQDIRIVQNGLAAAAFAVRLEGALKHDFDTAATIIFLKEMIMEEGMK